MGVNPLIDNYETIPDAIIAEWEDQRYEKRHAQSNNQREETFEQSKRLRRDSANTHSTGDNERSTAKTETQGTQTQNMGDDL